MFGRKKSDSDTGDGAPESLEDLSIPKTMPRAPGAMPPPRPATVPPATATSPQPLPIQPVRPPESPRRPSEGLGTPIIPTPKARDTEARRLIVGRDISLSGEITSCERLVVEGSVEANLNNCREIEIAETGLFKGSAAIDEAEIRGRFEGTLTVRKRLYIRASGRVTGTVRYGQLEIECGGQISGDVQVQAGSEEIESRPSRPTVLAMPSELKA